MPAQLSRECRVVFLTAGGMRNDAAIAESLSSGMDWNRVVTLAATAKASAALSRALERISHPQVPEAVLQHLRTQRMISDFHMAHLKQRLRETLVTLDAAAVRVMLLKGAAMGTAVYQSFADRPMADIDLLVADADTARAAEAIAHSQWRASVATEREAFYSAHHHLAPFEDARGSGHRLELHRRAFPPPNPFGTVEVDLWAQAVSAPNCPQWTLIPSQPHLLVYACIHFAWSHRMERGAWRTFSDIARVAQGGALDWNVVLDCARSWKAVSSCYWALRLTATMGGVAIPGEVLSAMKPPRSEWALEILERHFVTQTAPGEHAPCPSVRMRDAMWRAAIMPRWSGHQSGSPADHSARWLPTPAQAQLSIERRANEYVHRFAGWRRYLGDLLSPRRNSARIVGH